MSESIEQFRATLALRAQAEVGEGPVLLENGTSLAWVDMVRGELHQTEIATGRDSVSVVAPFLGAVVPMRDGPDLAAALFDGFGYIRAGACELHAEVVPGDRFRLNDAKADAWGGMWAGSTHVDFEAGRGALWRWDGWDARRVLDGLTLPNGLGWSPDQRTMYVVDSIPGLVLRAQCDAHSGVPGPFESFIHVDDGLPDGLAVDADGFLWIAIWGAGQIRRYSPNGVVTAIVTVPAPQPSSCALSDDGRLWITSARSGLDADALERRPLSGSLFVASVNVPGAPVHAFGGPR